MKIKIVFITAYPIWKRDYQRLGISYFEDKGYDTEIWRIKDIGGIDWGELYNKNNYHKFYYSQLKARILKEDKDKTFYIVDSYEHDLIWVLSITKSKYIRILNLGPIPPETPRNEEELVKG